MSQWVVTEAAGLHTTQSPLTQPRGALRAARNVVIRSKDCIEPRRGQRPLDATFDSVLHRANAVGFFPADSGMSAVIQADESRLYSFDGSTLTAKTGSYAPPDAATLRTKFAPFDNRLHVTTDSGVKALDALGDEPRAMGLPKPFNVEALSGLFQDVSSGAASRNWLADQEAVGVRVVFCRRDDADRMLLGPPSEQARIPNETAQDRAVRVVAGIPAGVVAGDFVRIYMTDTVAVGEALGDEHWLLLEQELTADDIAAAEVTKDITNIEAVLSDVPLYTNPNFGRGIEASKLPPPWAKDICRWGGRLWAFNLKRKHTLRLTILGVTDDGDGTGLDFSNTPGGYSVLTLNGAQYVFSAGTHDLSSGTYDNGDTDTTGRFVVLRPTADPYTSAAIEEASKNLVEAINLNDPDVRAYYVAREDGWPGEVVIEEAGLGGDGFTAQGNQYIAAAFSPNLTEAQPSTNGEQPHGFACSDIDEPEAWPLTNYGTAGNKGSAILRGVPLRDGIFCLMSDGTVQVIAGAAPPFRVEELDSSARLIGPDTAAVLNNRIWALTDQGVVTIDQAGVGVIGLPVEADIRALFGAVKDTVRLQAFGFAYETERTYFLWLPERAGQNHCSVGYGYNYATKTWVTWPLERRCGSVDPATDVLLMGHVREPTLWKERKGLTADDLADEDWGIVVVSHAETTLTVDSAADIQVGDALEQGTVRAVVAEVTDATHLEVSLDATEQTIAFESGAATVYRAIRCEVEYAPTVLGAPGYSKNVSDFGLLFWELSCEKAEAFLATDLSWNWARTRLLRRQGYGASEWGDYWGDPAGPYVVRTMPPEAKASCNVVFPRFVIQEAFAQWKLLGYTLEYEPVSERTKP